MDGVPTAGEGSVIYNCMLCDSYSLITLGLLPDKKLARGLKGKKAYEDLLEAFRLQHTRKDTVLLLACPTCNTYARQSSSTAETPTSTTSSNAKETSGSRGGGGGGKKVGGGGDKGDEASSIVVGDQFEQGEFLREGLAVLCPSSLVSFEDGELPPVYADEQNQPGGKPKWRLAQGVGPAGLELDRSRTGRLHKPSLKPFGVDVRPLKLPHAIARGDALADAVREACRYAEALVLCRGAEQASETLRRWWRGAGVEGGVRGEEEESSSSSSSSSPSSSRPVLENWEAAKAGMVFDDDIRAFVSEAEAAAAEETGAEEGTEVAGRRRRQLYGDDGELKRNMKRHEDLDGHFSDAWQLEGFAS